MPTSRHHSRSSLRISAAILLIGGTLISQSVFATSYSWIAPANNSSPQNWNNTTRWTPTGFPNAAGDVANILTSNNQTSFTINLNQLITIGILNIGSTAANRAYTIATGTAGTLNFNNSGSNAQINVNANSDGDTISAPVTLTDSLDISNASTMVFTISGGISAATSGTKTITNQGTGTGGVTLSGVISNGAGTVAITQSSGTSILTLSGAAANTYTGLTSVTNGELDLNKSAGVTAVSGNLTIGDGVGAANTATVKLLANDQIANTSDVTINSDGRLDLNSKNETIDALISSSATASVTLGTGTLTVGANNESSASFAGSISGTGGNLVKTGTGTQILTGNNTFTGTTTINGGTLSVAATGGSQALASTSSVTVNSGGTLLLGTSNQINNSAGLTLSGGTFALNGQSEGSAGITGIGALSLTSTSTIDFAVGTFSSVVQFAGVGSQSGTLQITNWNGTVYFGGGPERLLFAGVGTDFSSQYSQSEVSFNGVTGYHISQYAGFYEVSMIPEPGTWVAAGFALLAIGYTQRRKLVPALKKIS